MVAFSECLDVDMLMWREDIQGSRAHVEVLADAGLLNSDERASLLAGLDKVEVEIAQGVFVPVAEHEDIHMAVEQRLTEHLGTVGAKLHTARSRNDQVATDVRLWLVARLRRLHEHLVDLVDALLHRVREDGDVLMPGFTHLQRGQPILLGHHLLAHAWRVQRDAGRVSDAVRRMNTCPLGAGAMAGTPHPIDRHISSVALGFDRPQPNAMDAVAARDHLMEATAACAIAAVGLSRMAEELVLWSTAEFGFVRCGDGYTTGSSIMPQKRNPDAAELVRGKTGRVVGALTALMVMVKGLPLAYNRDLQEDREQAFGAVTTTTGCTAITAGLYRTLSVKRDRYETSLEGDFLLATELADYLAQRGVPFREAHHVVGRVVGSLEARGENFSSLDEDSLAVFHPKLDAGALAWLEPRAAAERRTSLGGTATSQVAAQVVELSSWVAGHRQADG
jgi:argininosuccinate lyase